MKIQSLSHANTEADISKDFKTVLVLGGDVTTVQLVERLCEEGFEVVYVGEPVRVLPHGKRSVDIRAVHHGILGSISGVIGAFTASIQTSSDCVEENVGFVVVAQPPIIVPKYEEYGLKRASRVASLSAFFQGLQREDIDVGRRSDWTHVAFFAGFDGAADTITFTKIFDCVELLVSQNKVQCYVFTRHLKVAENGLESRYRKIREKGALFFAFEHDLPVVEQTSDDVKIVFSDPQLCSEFELKPDVLVIDERLLPPDSIEPILAMLPSSPRAKPYLTPASPRYPNVQTAKAGLFAIGPARGEFYPPKAQEDIESVVGSLKTVVNSRNTLSSGFVAVVEDTKCTLCLTCVRVCPHGAIQFGVSAFVDDDSCRGCGICVSECPMQSISLTEKKAESENTNVAEQRSLDSELDCRGKLLAFLCEHSAANAFAELSLSLKSLVKPIAVPCAGAVGEVAIIQAFLEGANGVVVAGCFHGNCASVYGTDRAAHRVVSVQETLAAAGLMPDRLVFVPLASNSPYGLAAAIEKLRRIMDNSAQDSLPASM